MYQQPVCIEDLKKLEAKKKKYIYTKKKIKLKELNEIQYKPLHAFLFLCFYCVTMTGKPGILGPNMIFYHMILTPD